MLSTNTVLSIGIVLILILLAVIFLIPAEIAIRERRRKKGQAEQQKDWEKIASHNERHVKSLRQEIEGNQNKIKDLEKRVEHLQAEKNKMDEKITQERGWRDKEKVDVDKKSQEINSLKKELHSLQETVTKEHSQYIKLDKLSQEQKKENSVLNDERRALDAQNAQLKNMIEQYRQEIADLKSQIIELSKKKEDTAWVAKSDYVKLEQKLKENEKILERIKRETGQG